MDKKWEVVSIYKHDGLKVMLVTEGHALDDVLRAFENVLRGSGFCFNGEIVIEENECGGRETGLSCQKTG